MTRALEVMRQEYRRAHGLFVISLFFLALSGALFTVWRVDTHVDSLPAALGSCGFILAVTGLMIWQFKVLRNKLFSSRDKVGAESQSRRTNADGTRRGMLLSPPTPLPPPRLGSPSSSS